MLGNCGLLGRYLQVDGRRFLQRSLIGVVVYFAQLGDLLAKDRLFVGRFLDGLSFFFLLFLVLGLLVQVLVGARLGQSVGTLVRETTFPQGCGEVEVVDSIHVDVRHRLVTLVLEGPLQLELAKYLQLLLLRILLEIQLRLGLLPHFSLVLPALLRVIVRLGVAFPALGGLPVGLLGAFVVALPVGSVFAGVPRRSVVAVVVVAARVIFLVVLLLVRQVLREVLFVRLEIGAAHPALLVGLDGLVVVQPVGALIGVVLSFALVLPLAAPFAVAVVQQHLLLEVGLERVVLLLLLLRVQDVLLLPVRLELLVQVALDLVEVVALNGNVTSSVAVVALEVQRGVVVGVLHHQVADLFVLVLRIQVSLEDRLEELALVQVHQLGKRFGLGGDSPGLAREEADLAEDGLVLEGGDSRAAHLLDDLDFAGNDEEQPAAYVVVLHLLPVDAAVRDLAVRELLLLVGPVVVVSFFEDVVLHEEASLLEHEDDLGLESFVEELHENALLAEDLADDVDQHLILQILIEHGQDFFLRQLLLLPVFLHLLQVSTNSHSDLLRDVLVHQILVNMKYLLLEK